MYTELVLLHEYNTLHNRLRDIDLSLYITLLIDIRNKVQLSRVRLKLLVRFHEFVLAVS